MTKLERKQMTIKMARKFEMAHMLGKVYLSAEGLEMILKLANDKEVI